MSSSSESSHMLDQDCEAQHLLHRTSSVKGFPYGMKKATAVFAALVLSTGLNIFQGMRSLQNTYVQVNMLEAGRTQFGKVAKWLSLIAFRSLHNDSPSDLEHPEDIRDRRCV